MKVAILGYGIEGRAAYDYWSKQGADITICDDNQVEVPEGADFRLGPDWHLEDFDLVVRSPIIRPERIPRGVKSTSVIREFIDRCPAQIIGVTGTKGKGTTSTLIAHMLEAAGKTTHLGGNIGQPPLNFLDQVKPDDYVVLELSSFQLMDATKSPRIAVCLMISPEHLDWHQDYQEYVAAKGNIFRSQQESDMAVYNAENGDSTKLAQLSKGTQVPYLDRAGAYIENDQVMFQDRPICQTSEVGLIGPHNLENVVAAVAATHTIVTPQQQRQVIMAFKGLEHRLEHVRQLKGVDYYNDSFAANPVAAAAAIEAFEQPKVLLMGGFDRGLDLGELVELLVQHRDDIRKLLLYGASAGRIQASLDRAGFDNYQLVESDSIGEVVSVAQQIAQSGDVVLLTPGFPSFDMFKNFEERGKAYKRAVEALA